MPTRLALGISLAFLLPTTVGAANEPTAEEAELAANPIPITAPWFVPEVTGPTQPKGAGPFHEPGILFINFDGADMQGCSGSNDPVGNCSTIMQDEVLPWGGSANARAAVVQMMQTDVDDFAYDITQSRPADDVDYDMVMVGDWNPAPSMGGFAGVAPTIDCWNETRGETAFTLDFSSSSLVAKITGQEAAHVWGLEHVDSSSDLLFPTTGGASDPSFENQCHQIVVLDGGIAPTDAACPDMHEVNCPGQVNHQNSYLDLLMVFGPRVADTTAPDLTIVSPTEGQVFPSGSNVDLVIEMEDNLTPQFFDIWVALDSNMMGDKLGGTSVVYPGPSLTIPLTGLPDGDHSLRVDIADVDGNMVDDSVSFVVGMGGGGTASASDGSTTDDSASGTSTDSTASDTDGTTDDSGATGDSGSGETDSGAETDSDSGGSASDGGGGCNVPSPAPAGPVALGAGLLLLATRRRA